MNGVQNYGAVFEQIQATANVANGVQIHGAVFKQIQAKVNAVNGVQVQKLFKPQEEL